jgi:hypothetical protein
MAVLCGSRAGSNEKDRQPSRHSLKRGQKLLSRQRSGGKLGVRSSEVVLKESY